MSSFDCGKNGRVTISAHDYEDGINYRKHPGYGQSDLKLFARNRRRFYEEKIEGSVIDDGDTPSYELGRLIEGMIVQPYQYKVVPRDVLSKSGARSGNAWKEWRDALPKGVTPVTEKQMKIKDAVYASIARHPRVSRTLFEHKQYVHPRVMGWPCQFTGLLRKAEADLWLPEHQVLVDIKTTVNPQPRAFDVEIWKYGYHIQAATYREMVEVAGYDVKAYIIIAIRNSPPYDVEDHLIKEADIDEGEQWNAKWMDKLKVAIETKDWGPRTEKAINVVQKPKGFHGYTWEEERLVS